MRETALWLNALRLARTDRFERLIRKSDVVYVPRLAFPVIPSAKKMDRTVIVHLHGYIPISYAATVLAPYEEHRRSIGTGLRETTCYWNVQRGSSIAWPQACYGGCPGWRGSG